MKKLLKRFALIILSVGLLFSLCSCRLVDSYTGFYVKSDGQDVEITILTDDIREEYLTSHKFDFATLGDVVFIPVMKEIAHGVYRVGVSANSQNGDEEIQIQNLTLKTDNRILFEFNSSENIFLEKNTHSSYTGWSDVVDFSEEETRISVVRDTKFELITDVVVIKNGKTLFRTITYNIVVKIGKTILTPT